MLCLPSPPRQAFPAATLSHQVGEPARSSASSWGPSTSTAAPAAPPPPPPAQGASPGVAGEGPSSPGAEVPATFGGVSPTQPFTPGLSQVPPGQPDASVLSERSPGDSRLEDGPSNMRQPVTPSKRQAPPGAELSRDMLCAIARGGWVHLCRRPGSAGLHPLYDEPSGCDFCLLR